VTSLSAFRPMPRSQLLLPHPTRLALGHNRW
jgi:hypothetical protein